MHPFRIPRSHYHTLVRCKEKGEKLGKIWAGCTKKTISPAPVSEMWLALILNYWPFALETKKLQATLRSFESNSSRIGAKGYTYTKCIIGP